MKYEEFKTKVEEKFMEYIPDRYQHLKLEIIPVNKINKEIDGIRLVGKGVTVVPIIYVNQIYEYYKRCGSFDMSVEYAAKIMAEHMDEKFPKLAELSFEKEYAKDKIVFQLINTEQNRKMLDDIPHRQFLDLSVIYRLVVSVDDGKIGSTVINNDSVKLLNMTEEELFNNAARNTIEMFPADVKTLEEVLKDIAIKDGMPEEIAGNMFSDSLPFYLISNDIGINGASVMLYERVLFDIASRLKESTLYILPSSIHEVIAVSASIDMELDEIASMVAEVNSDAVLLEERLSNNIYIYDKEKRKISLATDTNKKLD
jgi:hypothetical protein